MKGMEGVRSSLVKHIFRLCDQCDSLYFGRGYV